jgi:flagellar protein FlaG
MAGVSVSHMIMFIASMLVAATVAGALFTGVDRISGSVTDRSFDTSGEIRTDVEIISDAGSDAVYDDGSTEITILAANTGSKNLDADASQVDVIVDGQYITASSLTVTNAEDGSDPMWWTDGVVTIEIDKSLNSGDHRVKLIVEGDEEVFRFRVP